jgi:hypothetical protein
MLGLCFLSFFVGALLRNFDKIELEIMIIGVENPKTSSVLYA